MSTDHSMVSSNDFDQPLFQKLAPGIVKVKYHHDYDWDLYLDLSHFQKPVDMSLVLPHYRAYRQPVEHRMSMFIASHSEQTKLKICRPVSSSRFYLELRASTSNITVWLPSDFKGQIRHTGKAVFSSGFVNRIMRNVQINNHVEYESPMHDSVFVYTTGQVTFRMWDVRTRAPEIPHKEAIKRVFGCTRRAPETAIDWDFLLED